jgi:hypothetical protein
MDQLKYDVPGVNETYDPRLVYQNKVRNVLELKQEVRCVLNELDGAMKDTRKIKFF